MLNNSNERSVPVKIAAKVYKKDPYWIRAGLISGWLPTGSEKERNRVKHKVFNEGGLIMEDNHYIQYELNKNKDLRVELGGMCFKDKCRFIWDIIRYSSVSFVLNKETVRRMNNVTNGKNPDGEELD